jgi:hypothetical protein
MGRALFNLGWSTLAAMAVVALAFSPAKAGDRYGASEDLEAVDPCAVHEHVTGRQCGLDGSRPDASRHVEIRRGGDWDRNTSTEDLEAVDPCAVQHHVVGRGCDERGGGYEQSRRGWEDSRGDRRVDERYVDGAVADRTYEHEERYGARRVEEVEDIDPCAVQWRLAGRGCVSGEARFERDSGDDRPGRSVWRAESSYEAYGQRRADYGYVDACRVVHARLGDRCPYESRERIVETEVLPADFFVSEGGVGGGIVDFGGGGGGGGGFAFSDSFANANANASASAMASASARVSVSIMARNHMMKMMHYPPKMMHHGCGCKK